MTAKKGPLQTKLKPRRLPLLLDDAGQLDVIRSWQDEDHAKLLLLCDDFGIEDGPARFYLLSLALARKHCIGFQELTPKGKWTPTTQGYLVVEIERLTADKRKQRGHTVAWAADTLAKRTEWVEFTGGKGVDRGEALRVQYQAAKLQLWSKIMRQAFKWHSHNDTLPEWGAGLLEALRDRSHRNL